MNIRHATGQDMDALCALYAEGRRFMAAHGNTAQWRGGYPGRALLEEDLRRGQLYVCEQGGAVCAAFVFFVGEEPSYAHIDGAWLCGGPYGVVHRLCSPGRAKGAATACLQFCMQRCESLRIDTHQNNCPCAACCTSWRLRRAASSAWQTAARALPFSAGAARRLPALRPVCYNRRVAVSPARVPFAAAAGEGE